jgi:hypothetical protein
MDCGTKSSIAKLRALRDELCKRQTKWQDAFAIKDSIVSELNDIKEMATDPEVTKDCVISRIDTLLDLIDPDKEIKEGNDNA